MTRSALVQFGKLVFDTIVWGHSSIGKVIESDKLDRLLQWDFMIIGIAVLIALCSFPKIKVFTDVCTMCKSKGGKGVQWTEYLYHHKIHTLKLSPQCDGTWRWGLCEAIRP